MQHIDSQIIERVADGAGARLEVSKGLWRYLFFSCEPVDQVLLVNLVLSRRPEVGAPISLTGTTVCTGTPGSGPGCSFGNCCEICIVRVERGGGSCPEFLPMGTGLNRVEEKPLSQWVLCHIFCHVHLI